TMRSQNAAPVVPGTVKPSSPGFLWPTVKMHDCFVAFPFFVTGGQKEHSVNRFSILRALPAKLLRSAELPIFGLRIRVGEHAVLTPFHDFEGRWIGIAHDSFLGFFEVVNNRNSSDVPGTRLTEQNAATVGRPTDTIVSGMFKEGFDCGTGGCIENRDFGYAPI